MTGFNLPAEVLSSVYEDTAEESLPCLSITAKTKDITDAISSYRCVVDTFNMKAGKDPTSGMNIRNILVASTAY